MVGAEGAVSFAENDDVFFAFALHIEDACASALAHERVGGSRDSRLHRNEAHRDHGADSRYRRAHVDYRCISPLLAVDGAEGRCDLRLGNLLEALEVLARLVCHSGALEGTGEAELRGGMQRIETQGGPELGDGVLVVFQAEVDGSEKVVTVRVVGVDLDGMLEVAECRLLAAAIEVSEAEAVPDARVVGVNRGGGLEGFLSFREASEVEQSDAFIEQGYGSGRISLVGFVEFLERLVRELLVHESDADVVEACGFCNRTGRPGGVNKRCAKERDAEYEAGH